jgi:hypothetical protein
MSSSFSRFCCALVLALLAACGDDAPAPPPPVDAGPPDAQPLCALDDDCDDGVFCNGLERCLRSASAGPDGCAPAAVAACLPLQLCLEDERRCETDCATGGDADGDGHLAGACGGDDCDDTAADVNPDASEACDGEGRDEDCDPSTLAGPGVDGDRDSDGHIRAACCNAQADRTLLCGDDCADSEPTIHPGAPESCNGLDDDCDGLLDEAGDLPLYADADLDGYGDATTPVGTGCHGGVGESLDATDCDDTDPTVSPGAREVCDGDDETCDGSIDEGCPTGAVSFAPGGLGPGAVGTGSIFFDDVCPIGEALVGVAAAVDVGGVVSSASGLCALVSVVADERSTPWSYAAALSAASSLPQRGAVAPSIDARCPTGSLVASIGPGLLLGCAPIGVVRAADGYALLRSPPGGSVGPGGAQPAAAYECPPLEVAVGLFGYAAGAAVGVDGIRCGAPVLAVRP